MRLVGIDCASQDKNCGLALAEVSGGHMSVLDLRVGEGNVVHILAEWVSDRQPAILALDAPLGWPRPLSATLCRHRAGESIGAVAGEACPRDLLNDPGKSDSRVRLYHRPCPPETNP